jgi:hypothetical protein
MREDKLLPSDRKIIISLLIMFISILAYCIIYTIITNGDVTAITVSIQILFFFLTLTPMKRYFSTLETPQISQIVLFSLGIVINYIFGILTYAMDWNRSAKWTVWWAIVNLLILTLYATYSLLRDKGISLSSLICAIISVI